MLTKTINTTKQVPVKVLSLKWSNPPSKRLRKLRCLACRKPIGCENKWGLAWCEDEKGKYSMRLCLKCGAKAEQALKEGE